MRRRARAVGNWVADLLDRSGVIEHSRLGPTVDLAWPRVVTGIARLSQGAADLAMVGLVAGPQALAGLAFAFAYWQIGNRLSVGLAGGTISLVSRYFGAGDSGRVDLTVKASLAVALAVALPIAAVLYAFAEPLIALLGGDPAAIGYGAAYLAAVAPALAFEYGNKVASRVYAGLGDTVTPMAVRAGGAFANIAINAVLIFGLGLGVVGAALGTVAATVLVTATFAWGLSGRPYPRLGAIEVPVSHTGPHLDADVVRSLLAVAAPLMARHLAGAVVVFPLLAIVATFGPVTVAAFEIARRVRGLMGSLTWGFSIAASAVVGRYLGADDEREADAYGAAILRLSLVAYLALALGVIAFARPIARAFVADLETVALATPFVMVAAVSAVGVGINGSATGILRGAGDTRWPFYATMAGLYGVALPAAWTSVGLALGVVTLYVSLVAETFVPAAITWWRYRTGEWKVVGRAASVGPGSEVRADD